MSGKYSVPHNTYSVPTPTLFTQVYLSDYLE